MTETKAYSRKGFFGEFLSVFKRGLAHHVDSKLNKLLQAPIRPPGALDELEFLSSCTRCNACAEACPVNAIQRMPLDSGIGANSPYIAPRIQACVLCDGFPCIRACEQGALVPVTPERLGMGTAVVDTESCQTFANKTCSLCYDACPYPERALTIDDDFHPKVLAACVGCGACEQRCPVAPTGIKVLSPSRYRAERAESELYFGVLKKGDEEKD